MEMKSASGIVQKMLHLEGAVVTRVHREETDAAGAKRILVDIEPPDVTRGWCPQCGAICLATEKPRKFGLRRAISWRDISVDVRYQIYRVMCLEHAECQGRPPWVYPYSLHTKEFSRSVAVMSYNGIPDRLIAEYMRCGRETVERSYWNALDDPEFDLDVGFDSPRRIGIEETVSRNRRRSITAVVDLDAWRVVWLGWGSNREALDKLCGDMDPDKRAAVKEVRADVLRLPTSATRACFPNATRFSGPFRPAVLVCRALDEARRLPPALPWTSREYVAPIKWAG